MKIAILIPGNMLGGGVKMPVRLASHLSGLHDVTLLYPSVPHYTTYQRLRNTSRWQRLLYIAREYRRGPSEFVYRRDLSERVRVRKYRLIPDEAVLRTFDAIIYVSVWQYHEIKSFDLASVCKVHWSLADYLFCSGIGEGVNDILEAYCGGDTIVAPSKCTKTDLESYGIPVRAVIHGGIDPLFHDRGREWREESPSVLGYFQPAWWVKGGATLIQCVRRLRQQFPGIPISLFGHQGSEIEKTGSMLCDQFYTGLNSSQVADLYRRHEIFIYPSYSDGFQSPPLEAMACGSAVVATRVGAVPEYARHGENALLCDPLDHEGMFRQVERLIADAGLRDRLRQRASEDASRWTWDDCASRFTELLHKLV